MNELWVVLSVKCLLLSEPRDETYFFRVEAEAAGSIAFASEVVIDRDRHSRLFLEQDQTRHDHCEQ